MDDITTWKKKIAVLDLLSILSNRDYSLHLVPDYLSDGEQTLSLSLFEIWEVLNDLRLTQRSCGICQNRCASMSNDRCWSKSDPRSLNSFNKKRASPEVRPVWSHYAVTDTLSLFYKRPHCFYFKALSLGWVCAHLEELKLKMKWDLRWCWLTQVSHLCFLNFLCGGPSCSVWGCFTPPPSAGWRPDEVQMWSRWGPCLMQGPERSCSLRGLIKLASLCSDGFLTCSYMF